MPSATLFDQTAVPMGAGRTTSTGAPQRNGPFHLSDAAENPTGWWNKDQGLDSHESTITPSHERWDYERHRMAIADESGSTS